MSSRFSRTYEVIINRGSLNLTIRPPLRIVFSCDKSCVGGLNKLSLKIYNLKETTRLSLVKDRETDSSKYAIQLKIGYQGSDELIFKGNVFKSYVNKEGVDFIVSMECYDGGFSYANSRISKVIKQTDSLIQTLVDSMQSIDIGKISISRQLGRPKVVIGNPLEILKSNLKEGEEIFIDNEQFFYVKNNEVVTRFTPLVSSETGLINTPEREQRKTTFDTTLNHSIRLGGLCELLSKNASYVNGLYRVQNITYDGDSHGSDWKQKVTGVLLSNYTGL